MEVNNEKLKSIQDKCFEMGYWEELREFYKPEEVKLLIIGDDVPDDRKRFFYYDKVKKADYLFRDTMKALFPDDYKSYDWTPEKKRVLLEKFYDQGGYLLDVYSHPKKEISSSEIDDEENKFFNSLSKLNLSENCWVIILSAVAWLEGSFSKNNYKVVGYRGGEKNDDYIMLLRKYKNNIDNDGKAANENF